MPNSANKLMDKVCTFGKTCYCNPSFGERLSRIFITTSVILLVIMISVYLIYLNRNKIALTLAPNLYGYSYETADNTSSGSGSPGSN